jgi:hypothetical protein
MCGGTMGREVLLASLFTTPQGPDDMYSTRRLPDNLHAGNWSFPS